MSSVGASFVRFALSALTFVAAAGCTTKHVLSGPELAGLTTVVHAGDSVRATSTANVTQEFEILAFDDERTLRGVTPDGNEIVIHTPDLATLEYRTPARAKAVLLGVAIYLGVGAAFSCQTCGSED